MLITTIPHIIKEWGFEDWICNSEKYCGKKLQIDYDKNCSFHYHKLKDEVLYVQSGRIEFLYASIGDHDIKSQILEPGMAWHVPQWVVHQMVALKTTTMLEFSTQHFDSDSHRITRKRVKAGPCDQIRYVQEI